MDLVDSLPKTHRALVLNSKSEPPTVQSIPTPKPTPGSAVVRVLGAGVISYSRNIYNGKRQYAYPTPLVIGTSAIGRIAAVGPDATLLTPGQLVHVDSTIRGRDDPGANFLSGVHEGFTEGSRKLMRGEWRDSTYAEYVKAPLENCIVLNEKRLLGSAEEGGLGYRMEDLVYIAALLVPFGGLRDIKLETGETIIVSPATGSFGGAAVKVAHAMGARVIAMGRNTDILKNIAASYERVEAVQITGDVAADTKKLREFGTIDAMFDISPPEAVKSTHLKSGILALKHSGRVSLMGGIRGDIPIPHHAVMHNSLQLRGKWMYERDDIEALVKMIEIGVLKLGEKDGVKHVGTFKLENWEKAFDAAAENSGIGRVVVIAP